MKLLITGAFGGVGEEVLKQAIIRNYEVTVFELKNKINLKISGNYSMNIKKILWGDLRNFDDVNNAVNGQDIVIHLGAIIPPFSEKNKDFAYKVNVDGTRNIIKAIIQNGNKTGLVFTSSMEVMKFSSNRIPPLKVTDKVEATSNYTSNKIECEKLLENSDISWTVCRLGAVVNTNLTAGGGNIKEIFEKVFEMSLNSRIEGIWNIDAAKALLEASLMLYTKKMKPGNIFFIGGGGENGWQLRIKEFYKEIFDSIGFGMFNNNFFSTKPYNGDWLDTSESQKLLNYQNHTFSEFLKELKRKMGITGIIIKIFSWPIKKYLQKNSKFSV